MTAGGTGPKRRPLVAGNWKMHGTATEGAVLARQLAQVLAVRLGDELTGGPAGAGRGAGGADVVLCPPFTALGEVGRAIAGTGLVLGAQNLHWEDKGAFTGEVSGPMLLEHGCRYVIVGHSERRQLFGETDETAGKRLAAALRHGLRPILCVGETWEERQAGRTRERVGGQLRGALQGLGRKEAEGSADASATATGAVSSGAPAFAAAYEPVWAIGTGRAARGSDAQEVAAYIRGVLGELLGPELAGRTRILYGGSVKADNAGEFVRQPDLDGALVGGASLDPVAFAAIVGQAMR